MARQLECQRAMVYDRPRDAAHAARGRLLTEADADDQRQERRRRAVSAHARVARFSEQPVAARPQRERNATAEAKRDFALTHVELIDLDVVIAQATSDVRLRAGGTKCVHD